MDLNSDGDDEFYDAPSTDLPAASVSSLHITLSPPVLKDATENPIRTHATQIPENGKENARRQRLEILRERMIHTSVNDDDIQPQFFTERWVSDHCNSMVADDYTDNDDELDSWGKDVLFGEAKEVATPPSHRGYSPSLGPIAAGRARASTSIDPPIATSITTGSSSSYLRNHRSNTAVNKDLMDQLDVLSLGNNSTASPSLYHMKPSTSSSAAVDRFSILQTQASSSGGSSKSSTMDRYTTRPLPKPTLMNRTCSLERGTAFPPLTLGYSNSGHSSKSNSLTRDVSGLSGCDLSVFENLDSIDRKKSTLIDEISQALATTTSLNHSTGVSVAPNNAQNASFGSDKTECGADDNTINTAIQNVDAAQANSSGGTTSDCAATVAAVVNGHNSVRNKTSNSTPAPSTSPLLELTLSPRCTNSLPPDIITSNLPLRVLSRTNSGIPVTERSLSSSSTSGSTTQTPIPPPRKKKFLHTAVGDTSMMQAHESPRHHASAAPFRQPPWASVLDPTSVAKRAALLSSTISNEYLVDLDDTVQSGSEQMLMDPLSHEMVTKLGHHRAGDSKTGPSPDDSDDEHSCTASLSSYDSGVDRLSLYSFGATAKEKLVAAKNKSKQYGHFVHKKMARTFNKVKKASNKLPWGLKEENSDGSDVEDVEGMMEENYCAIRHRCVHKLRHEICYFDSAKVVQNLSSQHSNAIWCVKFSPCGKFLACGSNDGQIRIWVLKSYLRYFQQMREKYNLDGVNIFVGSPLPRINSLSSLDSSSSVHSSLTTNSDLPKNPNDPDHPMDRSEAEAQQLISSPESDGTQTLRPQLSVPHSASSMFNGISRSAAGLLRRSTRLAPSASTASFSRSDQQRKRSSLRHQASSVSSSSVCSESVVPTPALLDDSSSPFVAQPFQTFKLHTGAVADISWSKNYFILSASLDRTVRLWHVARSDCLCSFQHQQTVGSVIFLPRADTFFLTGSLDGIVRLWNCAEKKVAVYNSIDGSKMITAMCLLKNGKFVAVGTHDGRVVIYVTEQLKYHTQIDVRSSRKRSYKISGLEWSGDNLLVTSSDSRIRMYDLRNYTLTCKYQGHSHHCYQLKASFSPDGMFIICGSEDKRIYFWQTVYRGTLVYRKDRNKLWESLRAHNAPVTAAVFSPKPELVCKYIDNAKHGSSDDDVNMTSVFQSFDRRPGGMKSNSSTKAVDVMASADQSGALYLYMCKRKIIVEGNSRFINR